MLRNYTLVANYISQIYAAEIAVARQESQNKAQGHLFAMLQKNMQMRWWPCNAGV